jgi:hypothetical protein
MPERRRYKLIACEILCRELSYGAAFSRNIVDVAFLPKGLHDMGQSKMVALLQAAVDEVDPARYDAILLGYGLCNNGTQGLHAPIPIVVPRAHDCITLLMGSKEKYAAYFGEHPGTYYKSPGWVERNESGDESVMTQLGILRTYEEYVVKYGEENARYLMETLGDWVKNYSRMTYIRTPVGDFEDYRQETQEEAARRGWDYDEVPGDLGLLMRLVNGEWDPEEFLVLPPHGTLRPTYGPDVIRLED